MKFRILISFLLIIFVSLTFTCSKKTDRLLIDKIKIVSINWDIITRVSITPMSIWGISDSFVTTITDSEFVNLFCDKLSKIEKLDETGSIDVRISCLIFRRDSKTDTLSFGQINVMQYNETYSVLDYDLLRLLSSRLPTDQQQLSPISQNN